MRSVWEEKRGQADLPVPAFSYTEEHLSSRKVPAAGLLSHHSLTCRCILGNVSQTRIQCLFFNSCPDAVSA
jgi:hypothetical protein